MTNEPTKALVWPSVVATEFVAARLADAVDPADLAAALRVMRAAAATDLRDLERKVTTDGLGNPIMATEEQRHAQATWSQANDLIDRASGWRDLLNLADSIQQADVVHADQAPAVEDLASGTRVRRTDNGRTGTVDPGAVAADVRAEHPDMIPVQYDHDDASLTSPHVLVELRDETNERP